MITSRLPTKKSYSWALSSVLIFMSLRHEMPSQMLKFSISRAEFMVFLNLLSCRVPFLSGSEAIQNSYQIYSLSSNLCQVSRNSIMLVRNVTGMELSLNFYLQGILSSSVHFLSWKRIFVKTYNTNGNLAIYCNPFLLQLTEQPLKTKMRDHWNSWKI